MDYEPASTLASVQAYIAQKEADKQAAHAAYEPIRRKTRINLIKVMTVTPFAIH